MSSVCGLSKSLAINQEAKALNGPSYVEIISAYAA